MILSFKKQFPWGKPTDFEQKILSRTKIHTIREDPHGRWNAGRHIHFATGVRTKHYNCFMESECVSVQAIQIHHYRDENVKSAVDVIVDGDLIYSLYGTAVINDERMEQLAKNDGFDSVADFFKFFNKDFQGRIIHWTDFKY